MLHVVGDILGVVLAYLINSWPLLLIGTLFAVAITVYVQPQTLQNLMQKKAGTSIFGAVGIGSFTPLCACGTMVVVLSLFVSTLPWGPVMAFLISSPLASPSDFMFQTAFMGLRFSIALSIAALTLGLGAGFVANNLHQKKNFFANQFRQAPVPQVTAKDHCCTQEPMIEAETSCCATPEVSISNLIPEDTINPTTSSCCPSASAPVCCHNDQATFTVASCDKQTAPVTTSSLLGKLKLRQFATAFFDLGIRRILLYFVLFIIIGQIVERVVPQAWVMTFFGEGQRHSILLSGTIGLPLYVSGSASLPLMRSFLEAGASEGALLALIITGKATSVPVVIGISTLIKKKAILFYVAFVYVGGILAGYLYQLFLKFI